MLCGCAEKQLPIDELVRDFLYDYRRHSWALSDGVTITSSSSSSPSFGQLPLETLYRKYMRISEMKKTDYMKIALPIGLKSISDSNFFQNNLDGRKEMDTIASLDENTREVHVGGICADAYDELKRIGDRKENALRSQQNSAVMTLMTGKQSVPQKRRHQP